MSHTHKQVIVARKDLNMRKGKLAAQVAHASWKALLDMEDTCISKVFTGRGDFLLIPLTEHTRPWLYGNFAKVVVSVDSEAELLAVHEKAKAAGIITALVQDAGLTEFGGVPTYTTVAVGPDLNATVDTITGGLKLL